MNGFDFNGCQWSDDQVLQTALTYSDFKYKVGKPYYYGKYDWMTRRNVMVFDLKGTEGLF